MTQELTEQQVKEVFERKIREYGYAICEEIPPWGLAIIKDTRRKCIGINPSRLVHIVLEDMEKAGATLMEVADSAIMHEHLHDQLKMLGFPPPPTGSHRVAEDYIVDGIMLTRNDKVVAARIARSAARSLEELLSIVALAELRYGEYGKFPIVAATKVLMDKPIDELKRMELVSCAKAKQILDDVVRKLAPHEFPIWLRFRDLALRSYNQAGHLVLRCFEEFMRKYWRVYLEVRERMAAKST